ncbi:hypothetical protein DQ226_18575 [Dietzia maris]|uniref:Uncharacterized protein n=1 Tax=Dietzia maris TaxID=37915 RepID=A0A365P3H2_9ACTN|nr:hypothetical protein [Dietzia sp. UCD-THP]EYT50583.1 hypothetical protein H483_0118245 [Dietzia sp. UCD-THP]RBA29107.1 hypothetical protein DQ226_18575 [Dietzia maris]
MTSTTAPAYIAPGLEEVRAGYAHLRYLGVDAATAAEWLAEHVRTVTHEDLTPPVARTSSPANAGGVTAEEDRRMRHALRVAVKVYNRQRPRLSEFDIKTGHLVTKSGAAAVNRAAVQRETTNSKERPAFLGRADAQAVHGATRIKAFQVSGRLHIPGAGLRAFVAYFEATQADHRDHASVRLHDFQVVH